MSWKKFSLGGKKKKYSLAEKKDYYKKRMNDKRLTAGQRQYADSFLRGIIHIESDFNAADSSYWERRKEGANRLVKQKIDLREAYLREERVGNKDYVGNRIENDRKIGFHRGQSFALAEMLNDSKPKRF